MKYAHILAEFYLRAWALPEELLLRMQEVLQAQASGIKWDADEIARRISASNKESGYEIKDHQEGLRYLAMDGQVVQARNGSKATAGPGSVAVIGITGIISHRMNLMSSLSGPGGTSIQKLQAQFREAMGDGNCKAIIFDVDSPGGSVDGVTELAAEIYNGRKQKPSTAVINSLGASAAYWLASAASEVVITPSGQAGSIGVYMMHQDESKALENEGIKITLIKAGKFKAEGGPQEPLSDETRTHLQSMVNDYYTMFVKAIGQQRSASQAAVRDGYGQGRCLLANDAVKQNLADRIGTFDEVLQKYGVKTSSAIAAADSSPAIEAKMPGDEPDEDDGTCACACSACDACTGTTSAEADDSGMCSCACDACKGCTAKNAPQSSTDSTWQRGLELRRRQLALQR